jgi:hypothetical protein
MAYTGTIYRGVDYSPTWSTWAQVKGNTQTNDSDMYNDAFASLWANAYQAAPSGPFPALPPGTLPNGDPSVPVPNSIYRDDLGTIHTDGFHLVRLYDWGMNRGTAYTSGPYNPPIPPAASNVGLDHFNFLNYAQSKNLQIVVPVSDYFLGDDQYSWAGATPDSTYSFSSAPIQIQTDFIQFIASITDPTTGKIHAAVQSIAVGNEGDLGQGISDGTTASQFLARTNWWIYNLHQQINGAGPNGPDGLPVVNGSTGTLIPLTATMSNADAGAGIGGWWADLINGVVANSTYLPIGYGSCPVYGTPVVLCHSFLSYVV